MPSPAAAPQGLQRWQPDPRPPFATAAGPTSGSRLGAFPRARRDATAIRGAHQLCNNRAPSGAGNRNPARRRPRADLDAESRRDPQGTGLSEPCKDRSRRESETTHACIVHREPTKVSFGKDSDGKRNGRTPRAGRSLRSRERAQFGMRSRPAGQATSTPVGPSVVSRILNSTRRFWSQASALCRGSTGQRSP